jgi:hypothetical protein
MKAILGLAFFAAILVVPVVWASPVDPANPAELNANAIVSGLYQEDGPGFSEIGAMMSWWVQSYKDGAGGSPPPNPVGPLDGTAQYAPGLVNKDSWPGNNYGNPRPPDVHG